MGNPISKSITSGTLGELLVQLRLLELDIQAAPPLKDSGNDLVAIKGSKIKLIQVKTHDKSNKWGYRKLPNVYDVLAIVCLERDEADLLELDQSKIYLWTKDELDKNGKPKRNEGRFDEGHLLKNRATCIWSSSTNET